jgi:hypothetical protein
VHVTSIGPTWADSLEADSCSILDFATAVCATPHTTSRAAINAGGSFILLNGLLGSNCGTQLFTLTTNNRILRLKRWAVPYRPPPDGRHGHITFGGYTMSPWHSGAT